MKHNKASRQGEGKERHYRGLELQMEFRGVRIAVLSDHEIPIKNFHRLADYVTGLEIKEAGGSTVPDGRLLYVPMNVVGVAYRQEEKELVLQGPPRLFGSGSTLAYTAQYMAECLRTTQSPLLLIHAAAVQSPAHNTAIVLLGEKGAGKTTLALRLCHQHGYRLIGNDQIFLGVAQDGTLVTAGGNAWFHLRETAVLADPYLAQFQPDMQNGAGSAWNNKTEIHPGRVDITVASGEIPVTSVFHIRIDRTQSQVHSEYWKGTQRNLILHEYFGRHISGQATPLQDDRGNYLGSLPPINLRHALKARDALVDHVIQSGVIELFAPDSSLAVDVILKKEQ